MSFDPVERLRLYHAAINALDYETIEAFFAEDAVYASPGVGDIAGRDAIVAAFRSYFAVYPDRVAGDDLVEALSPRSARAVWRLVATDARNGAALRRRGEEIVSFDPAGKILRIEVRDA